MAQWISAQGPFDLDVSLRLIFSIKLDLLRTLSSDEEVADTLDARKKGGRETYSGSYFRGSR